MENTQNTQSAELTDYDYCEMRKMAYAYYYDLENQRNARHKREAAWDAKHRLGPIARWVIKKVRGLHDWLDEDEIQEALELANPMAGFCRWQAEQKTTARIKE